VYGHVAGTLLLVCSIGQNLTRVCDRAVRDIRTMPACNLHIFAAIPLSNASSFKLGSLSSHLDRLNPDYSVDYS